MSTQETKLKAIADAIREKDGTTEPISANDFPDRIRAIETGGKLPEGVRTITLTADPPESSTVRGGGVASDGTTITINAEVGKEYEWDGWYEDGSIVVPDTSYTFDVSKDRNLIATSIAKPLVPSTLNKCTWEQISQLSQSGEFANYFGVGDTKTIVLNGQIGGVGTGLTASDLSIDLVVAGIDHNAGIESPGEHRVHFMLGISDALKIALVGDTYSSMVYKPGCFNMYTNSSNKGGWASSNMRNAILGGGSTPDNPLENSLMAALPIDLRNVMKSVQKYTDNTGNATTSAYNVTATTEYLCLFAAHEFVQTVTGVNSRELLYQEQYELFKNDNESSDYNANAALYNHATLAGSTYAWTRSPATASNSSFLGNRGGALKSYNAVYTYGISSLLFV